MALLGRRAYSAKHCQGTGHTNRVMNEADRKECCAVGHLLLTDTALAEESTSLGGGSRRRRVLDLRGSRSARLAHGICAMHLGVLFAMFRDFDNVLCDEWMEDCANELWIGEVTVVKGEGCGFFERQLLMTALAGSV